MLLLTFNIINNLINICVVLTKKLKIICIKDCSEGADKVFPQKLSKKNFQMQICLFYISSLLYVYIKIIPLGDFCFSNLVTTYSYVLVLVIIFAVLYRMRFIIVGKSSEIRGDIWLCN